MRFPWSVRGNVRVSFPNFHAGRRDHPLDLRAGTRIVAGRGHRISRSRESMESIPVLSDNPDHWSGAKMRRHGA
jgi:hypothetical protein